MTRMKCCDECDECTPTCHEPCVKYEHEQNIAIRRDERNKTIEKIYRKLKKHHYMMWQSPQSFGQKDIIEWETVKRIFSELRGKEP